MGAHSWRPVNYRCLLLLGKLHQFQPSFVQVYFAPICSQFIGSHSFSCLRFMSHWMLLLYLISRYLHACAKYNVYNLLLLLLLLEITMKNKLLSQNRGQDSYRPMMLPLAISSRIMWQIDYIFIFSFICIS